MEISTEFYSDKIDINFIDVNAKICVTFIDICEPSIEILPSFCLFRRLRKFPIKYGDLYICGRGVRKLPVQY